MSVTNPNKLLFTKNVFKWRGQYHCALSGVLGFHLDRPEHVHSEQALRTLWTDAMGEEIPIDEGWPKPLGEVLVLEGASSLIPPTDPLRQQYFFGDEAYWKAGGLPTLPDKLNLRYFQQGPKLGWREGFFEAGQHIVVASQQADLIPPAPLGRELSSQRGDFLVALPSVNVRCFTASRKLVISEHPMHRETVMLLPAHNLGILIFRCVMEVKDIHANEYEHIMLALEKGGEAKPFEFYQAQLLELMAPTVFKAKKEYPPRLKTLAAKGLFSKTEIGNDLFSDLHIKKMSFEDKTFKETLFMNCHFENILFEKCILDGCQFLNCTFDEVTIRNSKIVKGTFLSPVMQNCHWQGNVIDESLFQDAEANDCQFNGCWLNKLEVFKGNWANIDWRYSLLQSASFFNSTLSHNQLDQTEAATLSMTGKQMHIKNTSISQSNWQNANFQDASFYKTRIEGSTCTTSQWANARLIKTSLVNNSIKDNSFVDSLWLKVNAEGNDFESSVVRAAHFKRCNTTNNNWAGVDQRYVV